MRRGDHVGQENAVNTRGSLHFVRTRRTLVLKNTGLIQNRTAICTRYTDFPWRQGKRDTGAGHSGTYLKIDGAASHARYSGVLYNMTKRQYRRIGGDEGRVLADIRHGGWNSLLALTSAIGAVDKTIARELLLNIVAAQSYERIASRQGYVPLNRADFYGCRRKVLSLYAMMKNIE